MAPGQPRELGINGIVDATEIGRGGFAAVYRAFQPSFERYVAVKVLEVGTLDRATEAAFQRECRAIGRLSGRPNILTVYESGVTERGMPYLVMAYMPRGSLQDQLDRAGPLSWQEVTVIGAKLARALDAAHQAGILHRDLKPANVLMSDEGEPELADFGIARVANATGLTGTIRAFTPTFASPEMWEGRPLSGATDVYSLGATLYALLIGQPPFVQDPDESIFTLMTRIANETLPDLPEGGFPDALRRAVLHAMARDETERPSAAALGLELEGVDPGRAAHYKPTDGPEPATPTSEHDLAARHEPATRIPDYGPTRAEPAAPTPEHGPEGRADPPAPATKRSTARPHKRRDIAILAGVVVAVAVVASVFTLGNGSSPKRSVAGPTNTVAHRTPNEPTTTTTTLPLALPPVQLADWKPCTGATLAGDDCATMQVPLNYADPTGRQIGVALARRKATGTKLGSLVINPGGPGVSGIDELSSLLAMLSTALKTHFDIVTFDPRGVTRSDPIRCATAPQLDQFLHLDPAPSTPAGLQALEDASRNLAQMCEAMSGSLLPFVGTNSAARDLEEIRQALGDPKLTYLGFSYGSFLGETYAELYPTHVRAMALDGVVNPALDPVDFTTEQAVELDQQLTAFFTWCMATPTCLWQHAGSDLRTAYNNLMQRITAKPIPVSAGRTLGPGEAFDGVIDKLVAQQFWPALSDALTTADNGSGALLLNDFDAYVGRNPDGTYTDGVEANTAIGCLDDPWPQDPRTVAQDAAEAALQAPEFGAQDIYTGLPCSYWPVPPPVQPHAISAPGSPPIVVIGTTGDPVTPYQDAVAVAGQLANGHLVTRQGNGHTAYSSSLCVRNAVDAYLIDATVPPAGLVCPTG